MHVLARRTVSALATGSLALAVVALSPPAFADDYDVVASGLDNPRGITVSATGDIYVAEAGRGGEGPCMDGPDGPVCFGESGAVTRISAAGQERVVTALPSLGGEEGAQAIGPSDVVITGSQRLDVLIGLGADPALRSGPTAEMGTLHQYFLRNGRSAQLADISAQELAVDPDGNADSNPSGMVRDGSTYVVADAGGNTLVTAKHGRTSTLASFPDINVQNPFAPPGVLMPAQAVPTSVAVGPDGSYYVSQLVGFPFPAGAAKIWRVTPSGAVSEYASGLTNVTDLAFADDGTLYAVELSSQGLLNGPIGALVQVPPGSTSPVVVAGGLFAPYGLALSGSHAYVTTGSVLAGAGEVLGIPLG